MKTNPRIISFLCGALALGATYLQTTQRAQACDCVEANLQQHYAKSDLVFIGQSLLSFDFGSKRLFLTTVEETFKGCAPKRRMMWLDTERSTAACGAEFAFGQRTLIHANRAKSLFFFGHQTSACSGNRLVSQLSPKELAFLNSREVCCGEKCGCADGSEPVQCLVDPCTVTDPCQGEGAVTCKPNYCGGCNAEYFNAKDEPVCLGNEEPSPACLGDQDCNEDQYCGVGGECLDDGACRANVDCNLPANQWESFKDCDGVGVCESGRCDLACGDTRCVDHEGYDFGECQTPLGWVVQGGKCVNITSGCQTLVKAKARQFVSKQDCETSCELEPTTFACGEEKRCDPDTSYCEVTLPGMEPQPGEPTEYYDCMPYPERCGEVPSCESCFVDGELGAASYCEELGGGKIRRDLALP